jgi:hypothetical protein
MIRARTGSFLLLLLISSVTASPSAQEKVQAEGPSVFDTASAPGVTIIRLWQDKELAQPSWPEVAVIVMTSGAHKEFHKNAAAFLNKYNVFSKPVRTTNQPECIIAPEDKDQEATALSWVTYTHHTAGSGYT